MYEFNGIGKRIEALRKAKGLTQEELATRLGITSQAVSKWENDASYPEITQLPAICTILGTSLDELFGKIKDSENDENNAARFPQTYKNLKLVFVFKNIACYSDKEVQSTDETNVSFTDGSMAELANKRIINRGKGEIKLLTFKKKTDSDELKISKDSNNSDDSDDSIDMSFAEDTDAKFIFGKVSDLDVNIRSCKCFVERSETDKTTISIEGHPKFIEFVKVDYLDNKLSLKCKEPMFGAFRYKDWHENKIIIKIASEEEKKLNAIIHGQGEVIISEKFGTANMAIHGSGIIDSDKFDVVNMSIHGSGIMNIGKANVSNMSIHGSGNINISKTNVANLSIHGSGKVDLKDVNEAVNVNIFGSGNVNVDGKVKNFTVGIHGGGNINAETVITDKAEIKLHGGGKVKIGRVKRESIEQCHGGGSINILNRGE